MAQNYEVIFLGTLSLIDTNIDDNEIAENAADILGTYGSASDPLASHIQNLTPERLSEDANDTYDVDNQGGLDSFRINGGAPQDFDAIAIYNATITYIDGTTATITAVIFQDVNGNTYLAPEITNNTDQAALTSKPIESLQLTSVQSATGDDAGDMAADRIAGDFKGVVDGTASGDTMNVGYTDAEGDQITATNDAIYGYGGNDTINGGAGNDTLRGGDDNDSIIGGDGDDSLFGDAGNDTLVAGNSTGVGDYLSGGDGDDVLTDSTGNATLLGGEGSDTFNVGFGNATVDGGSGGTDQDTLSFASAGDAAMVTFTGDKAGTYSDSNGDTGSFTDIEGLDLSSGNDSVNATASNAALTVDGGAGNDTIIGGSADDDITGGTGNDSLTGGGGDDTFTYTPGDGADTITDFNSGNSGALNDGDSTNNDFIDLAAFYDSVFEVRKDFADDGILNQSNGADYTDNSQFGTGSLTFQGASAASFSTDNTGVACFARGTMILTPQGEVPIEELTVGSLVVTRDRGPQPIRWMGRRDISQEVMARTASLRPVRLRRGVFGGHRDLILSAQHAIALPDAPDRLLRATHLVKHNWRGARIAKGKREIQYLHMMLDTHEIIFAEGVSAETMYPGPLALRGLSPPDRAALFTAFPGLDRIRTAADTRRLYGPAIGIYARKPPVQVTRDAPAPARMAYRRPMEHAARMAL